MNTFLCNISGGRISPTVHLGQYWCPDYILLSVFSSVQDSDLLEIIDINRKTGWLKYKRKSGYTE